MDAFVVSARKYRPQHFNTVVGQAHITTTLKNAIAQQQLAHAFLFCGPRGVGKTTCARILAKTINCEKRSADGEACDRCNSCTSFNQGTSFNIHELDAASNNSVEDIRELIDQIRFAPQAGKYKVYIVDEVHMLSQQAFNAFLKTLEEPPPYAIFILATTEKHKILPTILSRCQIFDFKRITTKDTVAHLQEIADKEKITAEKAALHLIAQKSEGCMRDSLSMLDKIVSFTEGNLTYANTLEHLNILDEDIFFRILEQLQGEALTDVLLEYDQIDQKGFDGDIFLEGFSGFMRNVLLSKDPKAISLLDVSDDFEARYNKAANNTETSWLLSALNIINETAIQYRTARNKKLLIELALIKLTYLKQALHLTTESGSDVKKKPISQAAKPVSFRAINSIIPARSQKPIIPPTVTTNAGARLMVEQPHPSTSSEQPSVPQTPAPTSIPTPKLGSLQKIRSQVAGNQKSAETAIPLTREKLQETWDAFARMLDEKQNHSAASNFRMATLEIQDETHFSIITDNALQSKFIEAERASLAPMLQSVFKNPKIQYQLIIREATADPNQPKPLNTKEHYQQLATRYPMIRELKERLKLEVGY
jgi:DNA polymerase-3 subunit gamma/tau